MLKSTSPISDQKKPERGDDPRTVLFFAVGLLLMLGAGSPAVAQTGSLQGTIRSEEGAAIGGATIQVEGTTLGTMSGSDGRYRIGNVPEGEYTLLVRSLGFRELRHTVLVASGEISSRDAELRSVALELDQIVVTGTRSERELRNVPAAISVVDSREFGARGAVYQGQELIGVPGLTFESGYEGTYATVQIRGVAADHHNDTFVTLVDGVPFMTNSDEADLERILPLPVIERVEIVRGPMSALYGRGGVSGAINYITRNAFSAPSLDVRVDGGSYGYVRPQLGVAVPLGERNRLLVHAFYERKDGWRDGTDRDARGVFAKNQWLPGGATVIDTYLNHSSSTQAFASHLPVRPDGSILAIPGGPSANHQIEDPADERRVNVATGVVQHAFTPRLSLRSTFQFRDVRFRTNIGFIDSYDEATEIFSWTGYGAETNYDVLFAEPQFTWAGNRVRLVAGASAERLSGHSMTLWTGQHGFTPGAGFLFYAQRKNTRTGEWLSRDAWVSDTRMDARYTNLVLGAYAQGEWDLTSRAMLTLGARFDRFGREADFAEVAPRGQPIPAVTAEEENQRLSPKASLTFRWTPTLTTYASYGEGFAPAFGLMSGFASRDDGLKPEVARSYEVGFKGSAWGERLGFALALFHMDRENLVVQMFGTGEERIRFTNAGGQYSRGVEWESRASLASLLPGLSTYLSYAYTQSRWDDYRFVDSFTEEEFDFSGKHVPSVSPHQLTVRLNYDPSRAIGLGVSYDFRSDYWLDRPNQARGGGYGLVGANVSWSPSVLGGSAAITLTATNLLDTTYHSYYATNHQVVGAYPGRPRELLAGLRYYF